ncbi:MAG: 23S rRNA (uracil(1939)-C(5))-methyltransferase RlmD, partial [Hornefia sp.]|nr:23S rRNA (uracil(1939)-C(5))-methyltransferase RlmD [Hornefia sp.]
MEKGQFVELRIDDMTVDGQGLGRMPEGPAVFVRGAVIGDVVSAKLTKIKRRYALGKLEKVIEASEHRREGFCDLQEECGGCPYGKLTYEMQAALKEKHVKDALIRIAGIEFPKVNEIVKNPVEFGYRNKAVMPIWTGGIITRKGGIVENLGEPSIGFYKAKSHEVVDCHVCMLQPEPVRAVSEAVRTFMKADNITAYDPKWEKGLMRSVTVRTTPGTGEVMVIFVINGKGIPNAQKLIDMLDEAVCKSGYLLESVILNINRNKKETYGERNITLAGKPTIKETAGGMEFEISPLSFFQVNTAQMEKLYDLIADYAKLSGGETILDLYCGAGTIGLWLLNSLRHRMKNGDVSEKAFSDTRVIGIESSKSSILDANRNAVINGFVNARYVRGKSEEELPKLMGEALLKDEALRVKAADLVILDPPRSGCREELLKTVSDACPEKIVYVSCDPATMARDIKLLAKRGYAFVEATPVDMFSWTGHVESIVLLSHKSPDSHIDVKVEFGEGEEKVPLDKIAERAKQYQPAPRVT